MPDNWDPTITPTEKPQQPENVPESDPPQFQPPQQVPPAQSYIPPEQVPPAQSVYSPMQPPYMPAPPPFAPVQPPYPPAESSYPPVQPPYPPAESPYSQVQPPYPPIQPPYSPYAVQPPYPPAQPPYPPVQPPYPGQPPYPPVQQGYPMEYLPQQSYPPLPLGQQPQYQAPQLTDQQSRTGVIVGVVIAVVVLALVGVGIWWMANQSSKPTPPIVTTATPSATTTPGASDTPSPGTQPSAHAEGSVTVEMAGYGPVDYTVTGDAVIMDEVGDFYTPDEGMVFVGVPITVTYRGSEDLFFFDIEDTALVTQDGITHEPDFSAEIFAETPDTDETPFWMAVLEPGESASGTLIFQVASDSTAGAVLQVGVTTDNPVTVAIGL